MVTKQKETELLTCWICGAPCILRIFARKGSKAFTCANCEEALELYLESGKLY